MPVWDLVHACNTHTKLKLDWIRTYWEIQHSIFQILDAAVTWKQGQCHWKWYEWVQFNKYYHQAKFWHWLHSYSVQENPDIKICAQQRNTDHYSDSHFFTCVKNKSLQNPSSNLYALLLAGFHKMKVRTRSRALFLRLITDKLEFCCF